MTKDALEQILIDSNHKKALSKHPLRTPFDKGLLVFFLTNGTHWYTATPRSLLLPNFLLQFPPTVGTSPQLVEVDSPPISQEQATPIRRLTFGNEEEGPQSATPQKKRSVQTNIMDLFAGKSTNPFGPLSSPLVRKQVSPLKGVPDQPMTKSPAKKKSTSTGRKKVPKAASHSLSQ